MSPPTHPGRSIHNTANTITHIYSKHICSTQTQRTQFVFPHSEIDSDLTDTYLHEIFEIAT